VADLQALERLEDPKRAQDPKNTEDPQDSENLVRGVWFGDLSLGLGDWDFGVGVHGLVSRASDFGFRFQRF
jgi:hypothetical protein